MKYSPKKGLSYAHLSKQRVGIVFKDKPPGSLFWSNSHHRVCISQVARSNYAPLPIVRNQ